MPVMITCVNAYFPFNFTNV